MIVINITISFAESVQKDGVEWVKSTYISLLQSCPLVQKVLFYSIDVQADADDCFAIQIHFDNSIDYGAFIQKYQAEFDKILSLKFTNTIGLFKTILRQI